MKLCYHCLVYSAFFYMTMISKTIHFSINQDFDENEMKMIIIIQKKDYIMLKLEKFIT